MKTSLQKPRVFTDDSPRSLRTPSDRYSDLITRVFSLHGEEFDRDSVMKGSQYAFLELCKAGLAEHSLAPDTEVIIFTSCGTEFDPKEPGIGASFQRTFGRFELHAIINEGTLGSFSCLHLGDKFVRHHKRNVTLIALDQDTNPLQKDYQGFSPDQNIFAKMELRPSSKEHFGTVSASGVVHRRILDSKLHAVLKGIDTDELCLHLVNDEKLRFNLPEFLRGTQCKTHDFPSSSAQLFQVLGNIDWKTSPKHSLVLISDVFSKNVGFALVSGDAHV